MTDSILYHSSPGIICICMFLYFINKKVQLPLIKLTLSNTFFLSFLLCCCFFGVWGLPATTLTLESMSSSVFEEDRSVFNQVASPSDQKIAYGDLPDQYYETFLNANSERPRVILIHGGFWRPEYDRNHVNPLATALAAAGTSVALIEYRRIPGNPDAMIEDVASAIDHIGGGFLVGHSAGGHLALCMTEKAGVEKVVALAPVADLGEAELRNLDDGAVVDFLGGTAASRPDLNPVKFSTPVVPVTIVHGELDVRVPIDLNRNYKHGKVIELPLIGHFELIDHTKSPWDILLQEVSASS